MSLIDDDTSRAEARIRTFAELAACNGMERLYTAEARDIRAVTRRAMAQICGGCPVRPLCQEFADEIKPIVGVWAGTLYKPDGQVTL